MDHREPPRNNVAEGRVRDPIDVVEAPPLSAASRLRRLSPGRLALLVVGGLGVLVLVSWISSLVLHAAERYIHGHPTNQIPIESLVLDPPVPAWFRGGKPALIRDVVAASKLAPTYSYLDLDLDEIRDAFRRCPWVARVLRVERHPGPQVIIHLEYTQPVAVARFGKKLGMLVGLVDDRAVLLRAADVEPEETHKLVRLIDFPTPDEPIVYGREWGRTDPVRGLSVPDASVREATRLAAFLDGCMRSDSFSVTPTPEVLIHEGKAGLYVQVGADLMFEWRGPRPSRGRKGPSDREKWMQMREQIQRTPPQDRDYWSLYRFTERGLEESRNPRSRTE